ncbi:MAG: hypothetical protein ACFFAO_16700, partial [Candidatus Hermodarchaeota archaeon]
MVLTIERFFHIFVFYLAIFIIFLITIYKMLKRDFNNRLTQTLSMFLIFTCFTLGTNFLYALISDPNLEPIVNLLHILAVCFLILSSAFLLLFTLMLYYPKDSFYLLKYQILFISIYFILSLGLFLIPNGVEVKILSDGTQMYPVWSLLFFIYFLLIFLPTMVYSIIIGVKVYKKLKSNPVLTKRMKFFIVGISCFYYTALGACFTNFLN